MSKIDRNRGAHIRKSVEGYRVVMYIDTPGIYFDETGKRVDNQIAEAAGFNVTEDVKTRARNKLRTNYERQIGVKFAAMEQRLEEMLEENPNLMDELQIVEVTPNNFGVCDASNNAISEVRLTYEEAVVLFAGLTGEEYTSEAATPPDPENPFIEMGSKEIRALLKEAEVDVPTGLRMPKLAIFAFENIVLEDDEPEEPEGSEDPEDNSNLL